MVELLVYHGTNRELSSIMAGSWVTSSIEDAEYFAHEKAGEVGGVARVYSVLVQENDVEWDIIGMFAGNLEDRGMLKMEHDNIASTDDLHPDYLEPVEYASWR